MSENCKREKQVFIKMDECFGPAENLSEYALMDKWRVVPYESELGEGNLLMSAGGTPPDVSFDPKLTGWYKIFVIIPGGSRLNIKLSGDGAFLRISGTYNSHRTFEKLYWKSADMTGQSVILSKKIDVPEINTLFGGLIFEPMTAEEVEEWKREDARSDTKRIYATDDMHNRVYFLKHDSYEDWKGAVEIYCHSDVEWLSIEELRTFVSNRLPTDNIDDFCFPRAGDKLVQEQFPKFDYDKVLSTVVDYGHEKGLKMSVSYRMGAWGISFPYDQFYFDSDIMQEHPEWRTFDRNGDEIFALSYAYEGVQDYIIGELLKVACSGCDAVTLIAHRGIPYVLFEKPVADKFYELYGEYPYELPLDEPRLNKLHCDIMTGFFRRLRESLDAEFGKNRVEVHLRSMFSIHDTKMIAIDSEELAREGLIDAVISFPQRHYEKLDGDIWQEGKEYRIDVDKYTAWIKEKQSGITYHTSNFDCEPAYTNYDGKLCGPADQTARIAEWNALEEKYGVKIYYDIMPRSMPNEEFRRRALELYDCGAERFALWDTYGRAPKRYMWAVAGHLGHKEELRDYDYTPYSSVIRVGKVGGVDVSRYNPMWGG